MQGNGEMEEADYQAEGQAQAEAEGEAEHEAISEIRSKMAEKLKELSNIREAVVSISSKLQEKREIWEKEHAIEIGALDKGKEDMAAIDTEVRTLALADYAITKEKKLIGGIGIRVIKKLEYEPGKAFNWASEHKLCLSLDKRAFEKLAKTEQIDFVKIQEEATATIPTEIKLG